MADIDFFQAFQHAWGSDGILDGWTGTQYDTGWITIGIDPPTVAQFNAVHNLHDQKMNWLYDQLQDAATEYGLTLSKNDVTSLTELLKRSRELPVGSIYSNADDGTNPATLLGYGTWQAFGQGRVPVGVDPNDSEFNAAGKVGGEKKHSLTQGENGPHTHTGTTTSDGNHHHTYQQRQIRFLSIDNSGAGDPIEDNGTAARNTTTAGNHTHDFTTVNSGSGTPHNNLQPYVTVFLWRRTA